MKEGTPSTEVLCDRTKDLLLVLGQTPQRYLPQGVQNCMLDLWGSLNSNNEENNSSNSTKFSPEIIEDEAEELIEQLDSITGNMPKIIFSYIRKLQTVIQSRRLAS